MPQFGLKGGMQEWVFEYDATKESKAQGTVALRGAPVPVGGVIVGGYIDVITAVTATGNATVALQVTGAGDILGTTGKATLSLDALLIAVPDFATVSDAVRVASAAKPVSAVIATDDLLTGKFQVHLFGFVRQ